VQMGCRIRANRPHSISEVELSQAKDTRNLKDAKSHYEHSVRTGFSFAGHGSAKKFVRSLRWTRCHSCALNKEAAGERPVCDGALARGTVSSQVLGPSRSDFPGAGEIGRPGSCPQR